VAIPFSFSSTEADPGIEPDAEIDEESETIAAVSFPTAVE
jgi:hypothetical protein